MTAKLFRNSMAVAVSVMALSIILFMGVLYQYFSDQMMEALGTETWLVARGVESGTSWKQKTVHEHLSPDRGACDTGEKIFHVRSNEFV